MTNLETRKPSQFVTVSPGTTTKIFGHFIKLNHFSRHTSPGPAVSQDSIYSDKHPLSLSSGTPVWHYRDD